MQREIAWITLAEILGPRSRALRPLLSKFGSPDAIFAASEEEIKQAWPGVRYGTLRALLTRRGAKEAERIALWCHRNNVRVLTMDDPAYPACLRAIDEPPAVLYCRGTLPAFDGCMSLGVVGPRKPDAYGEELAYKLSFELAAAGVLIVSGMADGIDGIASAAALAAGGRTVAVLGCGIDVTYPKHHTRLAREILSCGAIVTEFAPGTRPNGHNFPMRNRIISALSGAVLVPEAGDTSGALITARYAVLQGKQLFVVPGDVTNPRSAGANQLLASGATMALCAQDILSSFRFLYHDVIDEKSFLEAAQHSALTPEIAKRFGLRLSGDKKQEKSPRTQRKKESQTESEHSAPIIREDPHAAPVAPPDLSVLTPRQREIYALLPEGPFSPDALTARGVPVAEAIASLTVFEIYKLVSPLPGGTYHKK